MLLRIDVSMKSNRQAPTPNLCSAPDTVTVALARASLLLQEGVGVDASLLEDGAQGALGHVAWVVGDGGVAVECWVEPDLMRACRLAVELQAELLQPLDDVPIAKARQRAHQVAMISG